ncbi:lipopolysaccharide biosynthesis protein [Microbacterium sp. GXF0217]
MSPSLAHTAARGAFFTLLAQIAKILLQLLSVVILSRLLSPHDYGLLAIVLVVVGVGEIFRDFGLTSASIQAPQLSSGQRDNLFWVNTAIGASLSVVLFLLSWPIQAITGEAEILGVVQWLSPLFLLNGLATQHRANLSRELKFRALAITEVAATAVALGAGIAAALLGAEYWALVTQQLVLGTMLLAGSVIAGRWLPGLPSRRHSIRSMIHFGWNIVATNMLIYAGSQIDTVIIGLRFGTTQLGLYNRAFQLVMTPLGQVRAPMKGVALPVLSRVQEDSARFNTYITSAQLALGYALGIPLALLAGLAEPVVALLLGAQWGEAAPIVRCFAIAGLLTTLSYVGYWVYLSRGLGTQLFRYTIVTTLIKAACIVVGSMFGLLGVAIAFAIAPAIAWPLSIAWLARITPMPVRRLYAGASRVLLVTLGVGLAGYAVNAADLTPVASIGLGFLAGALVVGLFIALPVYRRDLRSLIEFVKLMLTRER